MIHIEFLVSALSFSVYPDASPVWGAVRAHVQSSGRPRWPPRADTGQGQAPTVLSAAGGVHEGIESCSRHPVTRAAPGEQAARHLRTRVPAPATCAIESPRGRVLPGGSPPSAALYTPRNPPDVSAPHSEGPPAPLGLSLETKPGSCLVSSHPRLRLPGGAAHSQAWAKARARVSPQTHSCSRACITRDTRHGSRLGCSARRDRRPS